ncbi:hypothetical protein VNO77_25194 [Canavalia gladiata]|uniref:Uncharacterized protein n=1 Tax=Canavalia gladiata TaxID=3824 RepID=A0AAN9L7N6_CANGL
MKGLIWSRKHGDKSIGVGGKKVREDNIEEGEECTEIRRDRKTLDLKRDETWMKALMEEGRSLEAIKSKKSDTSHESVGA